ncbi:ArnT family glycosyltransferase [Paraburkholderia kururiensis]|uniref:Glycosyl transferase n=1 Tax=Paraburkholderia kururiensis TaxID=984307 RepID=A0ABZ0WIH2_9BURK|nr:glycosyl transferase [Paraburkholderia kururiensis]WQD77133.1 glycosyl transferase [Paraburkholderia kururiensis]
MRQPNHPAAALVGGPATGTPDAGSPASGLATTGLAVTAGAASSAAHSAEGTAPLVQSTAHLSQGEAVAPVPADPLGPPLAPASGTRALAWSRRLIWLVAIALVCAWLLPGTLGHDPWKQDETYTFGIIQHMLETGDLVVPTNAGQPFVEKPPLYDWVAAGLAWGLGRYLPLHDAARLASALFAALALYFTARLAKRATGAARWLDLRVIGTLALFAGSFVVIKHVHDMMTDVALMAGAAMGLCGLYELVTAHLASHVPAHGDTGTAPPRNSTNAQTNTRVPAALLGAGVGITLMTKGLFLPLVFGATVCGVLVLYPACRSRAFMRSLAVAALVCAPFALIWPVCFYLRSEALFKVWFWDNNVGRFLGFSVPELGSENDGHLFALRAVLTAGFPAGPLAFVALATGTWRRWREPQVALPALFAGIGLAVLQTSATVRVLYILPFMPALAVLAADGIRRLPQRLAVAWDMAGRVLFGALVLLAWIIWSTMTGPVGTHATLARLGRWLPLDWTMPVRPALVVAAIALTAGWLWLLPALKHSGRWRGALSWCLGATAAWGLVSTLLLPWLDEAKSYRSVFEDLSAHLAVEWNEGDCMASSGLGESEAPMLYYFAGIEHVPADPATTECTWLIVESRRNAARSPGDDWQLFWSGARPGDTDELLRVFVRTPDTMPPLD